MGRVILPQHTIFCDISFHQGSSACLEVHTSKGDQLPHQPQLMARSQALVKGLLPCAEPPKRKSMDVLQTTNALSVLNGLLSVFVQPNLELKERRED